MLCDKSSILLLAVGCTHQDDSLTPGLYPPGAEPDNMSVANDAMLYSHVTTHAMQSAMACR